MYIGNVGNTGIYENYEGFDKKDFRLIVRLLVFCICCFGLAVLIGIYGVGYSIAVDIPWEPIKLEQMFAAVDVPVAVVEAEIAETLKSTETAYVEDALEVQLLPTALPGIDTDFVIIDPGHGGEDEGCGRNGILEKDINLQLALALQDKLKGRGYEVLLTRAQDCTLSLEERVEIANATNADIFISIHQNAYEGEKASGMETWYSSEASGKDSSRLAKLLHNYLIEETDASDRGLQEDEELKVIREVKMPACLVETGFLSNKAERELLTDEAYQEKIVEGIAEGIELYFHPKTMYLTFDDGPSAENTNAVLDILKKEDIKATFFVIGENVLKHPEVAKRIVEDGHTIGIHCNNHDYDTLYESVESYIEDFETARQIVCEVTGVETTLFRFPGGSINAYNKKIYQELIVEMEKKGYTYYDWNASLEDAVKKSEPEQLIQNAKESTLGRKKVVMLAHDIVYNTTLCLEELIAEFPEYQILPLTPEIDPIQF